MQHEDEWLHCSFSSLHLQPQQQESQKREVGLIFLEIAQTYTTGCSYFHQALPSSAPPRPSTKQVWFDLAYDLGNAPQLPVNVAGFLEQPEGATEEQGNAQCPPAPSVTGPQLLKRELPKMTHHYWGIHIQVQHCPIHWVGGHWWDQTQMPHYARPCHTPT